MIIGVSGKLNSGKDTVGKIIQLLTFIHNVKTDNKKYYEINNVLYQFNNSNIHEQSAWQIKKYAAKLKQIASILTGIPVEDLEKQEIKDSILGEEWIRYAYADGFDTQYRNGVEEKVMNVVFCDKERYEIEYKTNWQTAYKQETTVRLLLQHLGTEAIRNNIHINAWVNALFVDYVSEDLDDREEGIRYTVISESKWIITDLRFENEFKAIKDRKGICIRVNRYIDLRKPELLEESKEGNYTYPVAHSSETALDNTEFDYVLENNGTIEELIIKVKEILIKEKII